MHLAVGVLFVHAFAGGLVTLLRASSTPASRRVEVASTVGLAVLAWATVISGTWLIYGPYRAAPPAGAGLDGYPKAWLISQDATAWWHTFGMEWKEHVGWLAPMLATGVAVVVLRHQDLVRGNPRLRQALAAMFVTAFVATMIAATFGVLINKVAPNDFLLPP